MRVGLLTARKQDEHIPIKHGVIGQETTGPGGMLKALRTVPVILDICRDIEELAPNAWMLNFTNPAGIVTEAVAKHSKVKSVGLCNSPINFQKFLAAEYGVSEKDVLAEFVGINHLHWVTSAIVNGEEKMPERWTAANRIRQRTCRPSAGMRTLSARLERSRRIILNIST